MCYGRHWSLDGDGMSALVRNSSTVDDHTVGIQNSAAALSRWLQQQSFYGPLSGTTWVSWYRKKHSQTFISFFRLLRSIFHSLLAVHDYWVINRFCTNQALLTCWEVCLWQMLNVGAAHRPKRRWSVALCLCLCICLSQVRLLGLSKWLNISSDKQCRMVA